MRKARNAACFFLAALLPHNGLSASSPQPSAEEIMRKAVARAEKASEKPALPAYSFTKAAVSEELDSDGKVTARKQKVYHVWFKDGATHAKLVEVNGQPPAEADLKKTAENELNLRQMLGGDKSAPKDARGNFICPELVARFDFHLVGEAVVNNRRAYELTFRPRQPEPPVHRIADRLLNRISGTLWIDAEEYELARADVQLKSEVDLLGGIAGSLRKLVYSMTRTRVADGFWLNTSSKGDFEGRKFVERMRIKTKSETTDFKPYS